MLRLGGASLGLGAASLGLGKQKLWLRQTSCRQAASARQTGCPQRVGPKLCSAPPELSDPPQSRPHLVSILLVTVCASPNTPKDAQKGGPNKV